MRHQGALSRSLRPWSSLSLFALLIAGTPSRAQSEQSAAAAPPSSPGPVQSTFKLVDSPIDDIQWADSDTVFVLSENGKLYRSTDGGKAWAHQSLKMKTSGSGGIRSMHISRADPRKIFFVGHGSQNWFTTDMGKSYETTAEIDLHEVRLHPIQSMWLLGAGMSAGCRESPKRKCYKELYVSKDFGKSWSLVETYAVQFDWAPTPDSVKSFKPRPHDELWKEPYQDVKPEAIHDLMYATLHTIKQGNQKFGHWDKDIHFYQTMNYFKHKVTLVPHGNRFLFGEHNYLFVAAVNQYRQAEVALRISRDTPPVHNFKTAYLPVELTEHSYTILDTSEGSVFLHVNHAPFEQNADTGHVYVSDWSGLQYSVSLPYNHRSPDGKCDFEKVEGLEGIYLANFIDETDEGVKEDFDSTHTDKTSGRTSRAAPVRKRRKPKTVITFDKGGIWSYLPAPARDSNGKAIQCGKGCHLHLHGITDLYGPFYSSETATGVIMGTGTVGKYLAEDVDAINTYLSRDAGLTWYEVAKGSHIYEFGDHGGIVVMAYDEGETDSVKYSWDQGVTWDTLKISDAPMQVENVIIEPTATSLQFVVYGWQDDSGVLVFLDFAELHQRECQGHDAPDGKTSDYEVWTPSDGRTGGQCLLGHTISYTRRKRESRCFNPEQYERGVFVEHCACTANDFECDYGHMRKIDSDNECVTDPDAEPLPKEECKDFYYVSKGYRRVAGDTCTGGGQWDRVQIPCPSWLGGSHIGKVILALLLLIVLALAVATFYNRVEFLEDWSEWIKSKFGGQGPKYHQIGDKFVPHTAHDDDFGLDESEFGQSAQLIQDTSSASSNNRGKQGEFHGLAPASQSKGSAKVPALSAPPSADTNLDMEEFDPST